ncbi:MAG TPA: ribosome small subunit-dependent GTPase A [Ignavibacteriaceae bacterium]|nr:ribosome small subunit-dependent GTPase A [Ignavibacteriaceae bacterium]
MINLKQYGLDPFFQQEFEKFRQSDFEPGRIAVENRERYIVIAKCGEISGEVSGKFLFDAPASSAFPKTGDWVVISCFQEENKCIIHNVLKRRSHFSRGKPGGETGKQVIAANIDYLFIVQSFNSRFSINRMERYILMAEEGNCKPVIIMNKNDLTGNEAELLDEIRIRLKEIPLFSISCETKKGIDELNNFISECKTYALVGPSGTGKSTIINTLMNFDVQKTAAVRLTDGKGKHTTTRRELFLLPNGGIVIDSPGMREFKLWKNDIDGGSLFSDITEFAAGCKFADCSHTHESGCEVKKAVEEGIIKQEQLNNYYKLKKETEYLDSLIDKNIYLEKKKKVKQLHREIKRYYKEKRDKRM